MLESTVLKLFETERRSIDVKLKAEVSAIIALLQHRKRDLVCSCSFASNNNIVRHDEAR